MDLASLPPTKKIGILEGNLCAIHYPGGWIVTYQHEGKDLLEMKLSPTLQDAVRELAVRIGLRDELITPEWLEEHGYSHRIQLGYEEWISRDNQIILSRDSNMLGRDWYVHLDNSDFQTIGGMCVQEVWQLLETLKLAGKEEGS